MEFYLYPSERKCGKLVANTLQSIGGKGTADDLLDEISYAIGQPEEIVEPKLKRVLRQAIRDGFLIRKGKTYSFPGHEYEVDAGGSTSESTKRIIDRDRSKFQNKRQALFLIRKGNTYSFPGHEYEVDTRSSKRGRTYATRVRSEKERKAIASKSQNKIRKLQAMNQSKSRSSYTRSLSKSRSGAK